MIYSSTNPEYVSLAANYIPDDYEVDVDDVELTKFVGNGNFGKVRFRAMFDLYVYCVMLRKTVILYAANFDFASFTCRFTWGTRKT